MIITGAERVMCCVAGSDGQLHMAFPPKALLMLAAVVWAGAAGSGRGQSSCHLPPSQGMGKPRRYARQKCNSRSLKGSCNI